jgi:hypothetical protein
MWPFYYLILPGVRYRLFQILLFLSLSVFFSLFISVTAPVVRCLTRVEESSMRGE